MPDIAFRMRDVRWVSGIVSGIHLMYAGAISVPEMQKMSIYAGFWVFKYKMVSEGNAGYYIPDARCEMSFRHSFQHLFNLFRGNLQDQNRKKWSFILISNVFKYKWHLMEMLDNWFRMWVVRWVSGIVSGIDFIYSGAISTPEIQENDHLHWSSMNLDTDGVWWRVQWNQ